MRRRARGWGERPLFDPATRRRSTGSTSPDHWASLGGIVEPSESPEAVIRREICEELGYRASEVELFTEYRLVMPFPEPRIERLTFFAIPIYEAEVGNFVLNEGADLRFFEPEKLAAEARAVPWDLAAVLMHTRRETLFRPAGPRPAI